MEFDVFVLLGRDIHTGAVVPLGCNERHSTMERVQKEVIETLRLGVFAGSQREKDNVEKSIASMAIVPGTIKLDL